MYTCAVVYCEVPYCTRCERPCSNDSRAARVVVFAWVQLLFNRGAGAAVCLQSMRVYWFVFNVYRCSNKVSLPLMVFTRQVCFCLTFCDLSESRVNRLSALFGCDADWGDRALGVALIKPVCSHPDTTHHHHHYTQSCAAGWVILCVL